MYIEYSTIYISILSGNIVTPAENVQDSATPLPRKHSTTRGKCRLGEVATNGKGDSDSSKLVSSVYRQGIVRVSSFDQRTAGL